MLVKHLESRLKAGGFLRETPEWLKVRNTEEERLDGVSSTQRGSILWDPGYPRSPRSGRGGDQEGGMLGNHGIWGSDQRGRILGNHGIWGSDQRGRILGDHLPTTKKKKSNYRQSGEIKPPQGRLGVLLPGLSGAVSTTFIAGIEAIKRGLGKPFGSLTQMGTIRLGKRTEKRSPHILDFVLFPSLIV